MNKRQQEIVNAYRGGLTLRGAARKLGVSMQRVHYVVTQFAPELMRPRFVHKRKKKAP